MKLFFLLLYANTFGPFFLDGRVRHTVVQDHLNVYFTSAPKPRCAECFFRDVVLPPGNYATHNEVFYSLLEWGREPAWRRGKYQTFEWATNEYLFVLYCTPGGTVLHTEVWPGHSRSEARPRATPLMRVLGWVGRRL
jgi:hypothetical protein